MLRSMYSGVAGLKVHQTRMDVIGNNIANVNTTAYKYSSINFSDVMYQTSQNASGATQTTGGINAKQVGLGAINASISTAINQEGATQTTNNPFDMRISGSSFFIVNDGAGPKYTRDGSFYIDGQGNLAMQSTGYYVLGWGVQEDPATGGLSVNKNGGIGKMALNTADAQTYPAEATAQGIFTGNIDKNDGDVTSSKGKLIQYEFYDNKGYLYTANFVLKDIRDADPKNPVVTPGYYSLELTDILDSNQKSIRECSDGSGNKYSFEELGINFGGTTDYPDDAPAHPQKNASNAIILKFNDNTGAYEGMIRNVTKDASGEFQFNTGDLVTATQQRENYMDALLTFSPDLVDADAYGPDDTPILKPLLEAMGTDPNSDIGAANGGETAKRWINFDFSTVRNDNTDGRATIKTSKGNLEGNETGRKVGTLTGLQVSVDGKVTASYSNGQTRLMGQIAVAQFSNASGLEKEGENLYSETLNSGAAAVMDVSEDGGSMSTGVLEMSNVDLSNEFTSMITAQRGFQANSRIITVSDTLLEELTNLKR